MDLLSWIISNRPGLLTTSGDRIEIAHQKGDHSTLWLNEKGISPAPLRVLGDIYTKYDGADLFSSTFKIASINHKKVKANVNITFTLNDIQREVILCGAKFPEDVVPFMIQQGIGIYAVGCATHKIYEWDTEFNEITDEYQDLTQVFDEWLNAVS